MNWLNRFKLWHKITLGVAIALVVMAGMVTALFANMTEALSAIENEKKGVEIHRELRALLGTLQTYRNMTIAVLQGDAAAKPVAERAKAELLKSLDAVDAIHAKYADVLKANDRIAAFKQKLAEVLAVPTGTTPESFFAAGSAAGMELLALSEYLAQTSGLLLDSEIGSFFAMEAAVRTEPLASEEIALGQAWGLLLLRKGNANQDELGQLVELYGLIQAHGRAAGRALDSAMELSPALKEKLGDLSKKPYVAVRRWGNALNDMAAGQNLADVNKKSYQDRADEAIAARRVLYDGAIETLAESLATRGADVRQQRVLVIGTAAAAIGFVALFFLLMIRDMTRRLRRAEKVATAVVEGDFATTFDVSGRDEVAKVLRAFDGVKGRLRTMAQAQALMAEAHARGDTDYRIDTAAQPGEYAALAERSNALVAQHIATNDRLLEVIDRYGRGDFSVDMPELPGKQRAITEAAARVKANLLSVAEEIDRLAGAAAEGDFAARGEVGRYEAKFQEMVGSLNRLMDVTEGGLDDTRAMFASLATGDLTQRMAGNYDGVFAQLRDAANDTMERLAGLIEGIRGSADSINQAGSEIAQGNADLSSRTEEQAVSIEQATSSMQQFTTTVQQNATNAQQANELARGASKTALRGGELVKEVVSTMSAIAGSSKRVQDIIAVIDGIAFQTNILALNAAVEAARAGEQGKGFAVVASEVRNLAQRSAAAAKEIKGLIGESVGRVDSGAGLVGQAGAQMQEIVSAVQRVTDIVAEIAAASAEQAGGIEQVSNAMGKMDEVTKQNAALVEESAAAAEQLQEQAQGLVQSVGAFRLNDDEAAVAHAAPTRNRAAA